MLDDALRRLRSDPCAIDEWLNRAAVLAVALLLLGYAAFRAGLFAASRQAAGRAPHEAHEVARPGPGS